MNKLVTVGIAEGKIAFSDSTLVTYALGSCVGVCLYERERKIAGMVHILLPSHYGVQQPENKYKFADSGIDLLMKRMGNYGAKRNRMVAKIAGGAEMFQVEACKTGIGERNVMAVKKRLQQLDIPIVAEDTGKNFGRTIWFFSRDGSLKVKSINNGIEII